MQTGQNSIAPENSLPQLGQVRWGSVLMGLTALQPQSEPKATPRSTEWCESGQHGVRVEPAVADWLPHSPVRAQLRHTVLQARISLRRWSGQPLGAVAGKTA